MKKGLVLEGGGMRGLFTAGVMDVLMENGITFDTIAGVSAGATFGANLKSGQAGRVLRFNLNHGSDDRYGSVKNLLKNGNYFDPEFCYEELPRRLDPFDFQAFYENPAEFYAVCTNLETGKPEYHLCQDENENSKDMKWIQASASLPVFSRPVEIENRHYLDGGVADPIPFEFMERQKADRIVVIRTSPADRRKAPLKGGWFFRRFFRKYPSFLEKLLAQPDIYNAQVERLNHLEREGRVFVIQPEETLAAGVTDQEPEKLKATYEQGRKKAWKQLEALKSYLSY